MTRPRARPPGRGASAHAMRHSPLRTGLAWGVLLLCLGGVAGYARTSTGGPDFTELRVAGSASGTAPRSAGAAPVPVARNADGVPLPVVGAVDALAAGGGDVAVAVYDAVADRTYVYRDSPRFVTGSVAKLSIMGETLRQVQNGRALDADDRSELQTMIENSSNTAASELWREAGRGAAVVGRFDALVGATQTTADAQGYLGLTRTTAADQVKVMRALAYPNAVLTDASRATAADLLARVEPDQQWGASGGVPSSVAVAVKNGWLPHDVGWYVNTVGHVSGAGRDYVVAILSKGDATEQQGIDRIERVSAQVWQSAAVAPAGASPSTTASPRPSVSADVNSG